VCGRQSASERGIHYFGQSYRSYIQVGRYTCMYNVQGVLSARSDQCPPLHFLALSPQRQRRWIICSCTFNTYCQLPKRDQLARERENKNIRPLYERVYMRKGGRGEIYYASRRWEQESMKRIITTTLLLVCKTQREGGERRERAFLCCWSAHIAVCGGLLSLSQHAITLACLRSAAISSTSK